MKALLVGATGATGRALLGQLLADDAFDEMHIFVRRAPAIEHAKLRVHTIDFNRPDDWRESVRGDVLFSCLGTTLKAAGSQAAQRQIDVEYQLAFARAASAHGVPRYVLVSAAGANAHARSFYPRIKGELERAVLALAFAHCVILRPGVLARPDSDRLGERLALRILGLLNACGLLRRYRPLPVERLAQAMISAAKSGRVGSEIVALDAIFQL